MTLVLLPGLDGTGVLFQALVAELDIKFNVHVVSYPTDRALDYSELEMIARESLPSHDPYILLGESFSGPIAVSIAASNPAGLVGVILSCSFVSNPRPFLSQFRFLLGILPIQAIPELLLGVVSFGKNSSEDLRLSLRQALSSLSASVLKARLDAVVSIDVSAKLRSLDVPVLYLRAEQDRVVPCAAASRVADAYPPTEVVSLTGPHCLLQALPGESARAIDTFVTRLEKE